VQTGSNVRFNFFLATRKSNSITHIYFADDDDYQMISSIAAGSSHSIAVTADGEVYTWGSGSFGRLGHGDHCDEYLPRLVVRHF